jgi:hypothetical protein
MPEVFTVVIILSARKTPSLKTFRDEGIRYACAG